MESVAQKETKIKIDSIESDEAKKIAEQKRLWDSIPEEIRKKMDPEAKLIPLVGAPPKLLAKFSQVSIDIPCLKDETTGKGATHLKSYPAYYLIGENVTGIAAHFSHADRPIYDGGKFSGYTFKRIFYVPKERLGTTIIAKVEVWRNNNGTLTINIFEHKERELVPQYKIKMRPVGSGEKNSSNLFIVKASKMALEIIEINKGKVSK